MKGFLPLCGCGVVIGSLALSSCASPRSEDPESESEAEDRVEEVEGARKASDSRDLRSSPGILVQEQMRPFKRSRLTRPGKP